MKTVCGDDCPSIYASQHLNDFESITTRPMLMLHRVPVKRPIINDYSGRCTEADGANDSTGYMQIQGCIPFYSVSHNLSGSFGVDGMAVVVSYRIVQNDNYFVVCTV